MISIDHNISYAPGRYVNGNQGRIIKMVCSITLFAQNQINIYKRIIRRLIYLWNTIPHYIVTSHIVRFFSN